MRAAPMPLDDMVSFLSRAAVGLSPAAPGEPIFTGSSTTTAKLIHLLSCCGPMTTAELGEAVGLSTRLVWGLLKGPRARGQVRWQDSLWSLDLDYPGSDVLRAAALLRANGWQLTPPPGQSGGSWAT